ncbi:hypothetical protein GCM10022265_03750 [Marinobacter xestospongiae]
MRVSRPAKGTGRPEGLPHSPAHNGGTEPCCEHKKTANSNWRCGVLPFGFGLLNPVADFAATATVCFWRGFGVNISELFVLCSVLF